MGYVWAPPGKYDCMIHAWRLLDAGLSTIALADCYNCASGYLMTLVFLDNYSSDTDLCQNMLPNNCRNLDPVHA